MKCDCCKIRKAVAKDCRIEYGQTQKYLVCNNCVMLADVDFFRFVDSDEKIKDYGDLI